MLAGPWLLGNTIQCLYDHKRSYQECRIPVCFVEGVKTYRRKRVRRGKDRGNPEPHTHHAKRVLWMLFSISITGAETFLWQPGGVRVNEAICVCESVFGWVTDGERRRQDERRGRGSCQYHFLHHSLPLLSSFSYSPTPPWIICKSDDKGARTHTESPSSSLYLPAAL